MTNQTAARIDAFAALESKAALTPFHYEPSALAAEELEIEISHCGICHSDLHLIDNDWMTSKYPLVPGHEIIGTVARKGAEVGHLELGDRVGVGWQCGSCLNCEWCERGDENLCAGIEETCVGRHGGFADRVRVDSRFAFAIPDALSSEVAAPLLCGGITVYSPLRQHARPQSRDGVQPFELEALRERPPPRWRTLVRGCARRTAEYSHGHAHGSTPFGIASS